MKIPERGQTPAEVLARLEAMKEGDAPFLDGRMFGHAFVADAAGRALAEEANRLYLWENGLDPMLFPSLAQLEREVVTMALAHTGGGPAAAGTFTSGGTESVLLAVRAARERARAEGRGTDRPTMVLPRTAHPCFHKAGQYLGVERVVVPVDSTSFRADPRAMADAVDERTILLVASAPSYAHGVMDPIEELGELALRRDLWLHVDGCIGAFLLPYLRDLGSEVPPYDLSVPGVSSLSMDFHKYAYAPKGASVVLYADAALRRYQHFACSSWPGYTLVNPTVQSSRSGGPLAATWAVLQHYGEAGYREIAGALREATGRLVARVGAIPGLRVLGEPCMTLVGVACDPPLDPFAICAAMASHGVHVYPQLSVDGLPASFHFTVLPPNVARLEEVLDLLEAEVERLRQAGTPDGSLAAMLEGVDLRTLSDAELEGLLAAAGLVGETAGGGLPMGQVNALLDRLPRDVTERVVLAWYDLVSRP